MKVKAAKEKAAVWKYAAYKASMTALSARQAVAVEAQRVHNAELRKIGADQYAHDTKRTAKQDAATFKSVNASAKDLAAIVEESQKDSDGKFDQLAKFRAELRNLTSLHAKAYTNATAEEFVSKAAKSIASATKAATKAETAHKETTILANATKTALASAKAEWEIAQKAAAKHTAAVKAADLAALKATRLADKAFHSAVHSAVASSKPAAKKPAATKKPAAKKPAAS